MTELLEAQNILQMVPRHTSNRTTNNVTEDDDPKST